MEKTTAQDRKTRLLRGLFVAVLTALIGLFSTATSSAQGSQTWSVVVHIEYVNGFVYEGAFATGVPASTLTSILAECGRSHWTGFAVRYYYCYPVLD